MKLENVEEARILIAKRGTLVEADARANQKRNIQVLRN